MLKKFLTWLTLVVAVIIIGTILICTVYCINSPNLEKNLEESKELLASEEIYYRVDGTETSTLDNYTDSLMLLNASYRGNESILQKGMNNYRVYRIDTSPYEQLTVEDPNTPTEVISYYRYWHGYLIVLRPLLAIFNYSQIRKLNAVMQVVVLVVLIGLMIKNKIGIYVIPLLSAYLLINPVAISMSLQNSTVWYIACISCIIYLLLKERIIEHQWHYLLFTLVGMVTSYMDFLTYPIVTLGLLMLMVIVSEKLTFKESIKRILICGVCWTLGYGIMWAAKWVIASIILGTNVVQHSMNQVSYRSSNLTWGDVEVSRIDVVKKTLLLFNLPITKKVLMFNVVCLVGIVLYNIKKYDYKAILTRVLNALPIFAMSLTTIVWYLVLANHTQIHPFLSFRTAFVLCCAMLMGGYKLVWIDKSEKG